MPFYEAMPHGPKANMSGKSLVELPGAVAQVFECVDMDRRLCVGHIDTFESVLFMRLMALLVILTCEGWFFLEPEGIGVHGIGQT